MLADFVNTTGDSVFDGTLKQALAVQLEQSPYLNVTPESRIREALRFMGRSPDERVTNEVAREVCLREGVKAMLTGSISSLGSHYVIDLNAVNAQTGDSLAREQVELSKARARIDIVAGDFFEDELPEADLYALGRILHDWREDKIDLLLRKILARLPAGGGLLVAEKLLNEDGVGPVKANMQSLNMLVVTEGRERTFGEYSRLLRAAGFAQVEGQQTGTALDAILAVKA